MSERATVNQVAQIGPETTPGTVVPATKILESTTIEPGIMLTTKNFRPQGRKYDSLVVPGKEWIVAKLSGPVSYTEIIYWLSALGIITPTLHTGGTLSHDWSITPPLASPSNPQTYSIEKGDSNRAYKFGYGLVTDLDFKFTRDSVDFSGSMIGQQLTDGITLTSTLPTLSEVPVMPNQVNIYLDPTSGAIGSTQLTDATSAEFSIGGLYGQFWPLNRTNSSFTKHIDLAPKVEFKLKMEADATGMGPLTTMRNGSTAYIRVSAQTATFIEGSIPYVFQLDMAAKVSAIAPFADDGGLYSVEYTFSIVEDSGLAKAYSFLVTNGASSL